MIQNVVQILRTTVSPDQQDWVLKIPMTEFAINSSMNKSTGFVPFELTYGYIPQMMLSIPTSEFKGVHKFTQRAIDNLQATHNAIIMSHVWQTMQSNKHQSPEPMISEGDLVYLSTKELNLPKGQAKKLLPLFIGPYKVIKAHSESSTYTIKLPPELEAWGIHPTFHVSRLATHEPNDLLLFPGRDAQVYYNFGKNPEKELQVHEILDHIWDLDNMLWFRVKWTAGDLTWEPIVNVNELIALDNYLELHAVKNVEELPHKWIPSIETKSGQKKQTKRGWKMPCTSTKKL